MLYRFSHLFSEAVQMQNNNIDIVSVYFIYMFSLTEKTYKLMNLQKNK